MFLFMQNNDYSDCAAVARALKIRGPSAVALCGFAFAPKPGLELWDPGGEFEVRGGF